MSIRNDTAPHLMVTGVLRSPSKSYAKAQPNGERPLQRDVFWGEGGLLLPWRPHRQLSLPASQRGAHHTCDRQPVIDPRNRVAGNRADGHISCEHHLLTI